MVSKAALAVAVAACVTSEVAGFTAVLPRVGGVGLRRAGPQHICMADEINTKKVAG